MKILVNLLKINIFLIFTIYFSVFANENNAKPENNKSYLHYLLKGDSLFNAKKYTKSYEQFYTAKKISSKKEGAIIGLYNSSIF